MRAVAMKRSRLLAAFMGAAAAAPHMPSDPVMQREIEMHLRNPRMASPCTATACTKPDKKYERIMKTPAGIQWMDHGGYCGSWSIQRACLAKGAWISQQQVRDHAEPGGGHDVEILETNIECALSSLKLKYEGFAYKELPTPQADAYRGWIKKMLAAGHPIVAMIMLYGGVYPIYPDLPYGLYSHIEPLVGIMSDHPLSDENWYDEDYILHYTDADTHTYYRSMESLPDTYPMTGTCAHGYSYPGELCINNERGFGWSIMGFQDDREGVPISLAIDPWSSEPETRDDRAEPISLKGTVTATGLEGGVKYALYRWDSVEDAFDYSKAKLVCRFTATSEEYVHTDATKISSGGATYYRCVRDDASVVSPHVAV